jgi:hypothetical protein
LQFVYEINSVHSGDQSATVGETAEQETVELKDGPDEAVKPPESTKMQIKCCPLSNAVLSARSAAGGP